MTDRASTLLTVVDELMPGTFHNTVERRDAAWVQVIFSRERREFVNIFEMPASEPVRTPVPPVPRYRSSARTRCSR